MGANMARRLSMNGHHVVGHDRRPEPIQELKIEGVTGAASVAELVEKLIPPRTIWIMVPSSQVAEETIASLVDLLSPGDTVIDGGNSYYKDSQRRALVLETKELHFLDVGTSGGIWGLTEGYSLTIGGDSKVAERLRSIFETLAPAPDKSWVHVGSNGAGHFVKMIHKSSTD